MSSSLASGPSIVFCSTLLLLPDVGALGVSEPPASRSSWSVAVALVALLEPPSFGKQLSACLLKASILALFSLCADLSPELLLKPSKSSLTRFECLGHRGRGVESFASSKGEGTGEDLREEAASESLADIIPTTSKRLVPSGSTSSRMLALLTPRGACCMARLSWALVRGGGDLGVGGVSELQRMSICILMQMSWSTHGWTSSEWVPVSWVSWLLVADELCE